MIVSSRTNNWSLLSLGTISLCVVVVLLTLELQTTRTIRSTTRLILENQFRRYLLFCRLPALLSVPSLQMSRKLFNYYIWHFYYTNPPSCPFITLIRFVLKISGFRYFPIHCHWYERDKFGLSVTIFIASGFSMVGLSSEYQLFIFIFSCDWLNIISRSVLPFRILKQTHIS